MDGAVASASSEDAPALAASEPPCPLSDSRQWWNVSVFAACTGLQYLAAPVLYVGLTQGSLLNRLGVTRTLANLPETAFFVATVTPVILASLLPGVAYLKRTLVACYLLAAASQALVSLVLLVPVETNLKIAAVIVQGAVSGAAMPTAIALLWEAIGRGVAPARRGVALGLAFGGGPLLAVAGSFGSQLLLTGKVGTREFFPVEFPWNFSLLFAAGVPVMLLAAITACGLTVVAGEDEPASSPLLAGIRGFLANRLLLSATIVTILLYVGNTITANMNLYTQHVLNADPADYAGYQNMLRFAFKMAAGILLGWLLTRSSPRMGILVTGVLFIAAQLWALFATGYWYLLAFGIYGAGELVGVYAPNYLLSASAPRDLRRNMAYVTMMMAPAAPAGTLFGALADYGGRVYGPATGFRLTFALCAVILLAGLVLAFLLLPPQPKPQE